MEQELQLKKILSELRGADEKARKAAHDKWNSLAKPLGSLGLLEEAVERMAALRGTAEVTAERRRLVNFCADHGVVAQGVSQSDHTVTTAVAAALGRGSSTVNLMAGRANCEVVAVDIGMQEDMVPDGVRAMKIRRGTADMTCGPAMERKECVSAILAGICLAEEAAADGVDILAAGEMGIGNTTAAAAVCCALLDLDPSAAVGRGAGLSDTGLERKRSAVKTALELNQPDADDPIDVLSKVGGLELAAMCGLFLGGALKRIPVLADGLISVTSALCAVRLCPAAQAAVFAGNLSAEPAARAVLEVMGQRPWISAGIRLGEGGGAVAQLPLLDLALAVYQSDHDFKDLGIGAYEPLGGEGTALC